MAMGNGAVGAAAGGGGVLVAGAAAGVAGFVVGGPVGAYAASAAATALTTPAVAAGAVGGAIVAEAATALDKDQVERQNARLRRSANEKAERERREAEEAERKREERDDGNKYRATGEWHQLSAALIGTCISQGRPAPAARFVARSSTINNLQGVVSDVSNMWHYLLDNGARVARKHDPVPSEAGDVVKRKIRDFILEDVSNNKLLYLSGHGDRRGDYCLGDGDAGLSASDVFRWLAEAKFAGAFTIVVDTCYAGKWAENVSKLIHESEIVGPLADAARARGGSTFIFLRLSSLTGQKSRDSDTGGVYTKGLLTELRREWKYTDQDGRGWGTKVLTAIRARCVFGITGSSTLSSTDRQTDIIIDFVINPDGTTRTNYPPDRVTYLTNAGVILA